MIPSDPPSRRPHRLPPKIISSAVRIRIHPGQCVPDRTDSHSLTVFPGCDSRCRIDSPDRTAQTGGQASRTCSPAILSKHHTDSVSFRHRSGYSRSISSLSGILPSAFVIPARSPRRIISAVYHRAAINALTRLCSSGTIIVNPIHLPPVPYPAASDPERSLRNPAIHGAASSRIRNDLSACPISAPGASVRSMIVRDPHPCQPYPFQKKSDRPGRERGTVSGIFYTVSIEMPSPSWYNSFVLMQTSLEGGAI